MRPAKVLRSIQSENTSPAKAYGYVFGLNASNPDLRTFRTLYPALNADQLRG